MATGIPGVISLQAHRRIDQLTFPGLLATAAWMVRRDTRAAAVILITAAVEDMAHLTTDYPPAILPWMSFRTHNRLATAHGAVVMALALIVPGISRPGRSALCALGAMAIALATLSDTRGSRGLTRPAGEPVRLRERAAGSSSYGR
jgi:hypothetical protein